MGTIRLAVLISGGGRTMENFIALSRSGRLPATVELVVSSRAGAGGVQRAQDAGVRTVVVPRKGKSLQEFSEAITAELDKARPDLICLAGFLSMYTIAPQYTGKVMNIHPALLPAFGGQGMYGHHVHEAVLEMGCKVTGCTVHFADNQYDHGPIIIQRTVPVLDDDTPDTLADRVFEQETIAYPEAVRLFAAGRLRIEGRRVRTRLG
ncbi:MAG: phosphoribosylglycinamide formyltransferase [Phycisphaerae bacterium]|nr:phosphoribosylglycinamide formyltransferase [Phycisphaerae bacterium]